MRIMRQLPNDDATEAACGMGLAFGDANGFMVCVNASNGHGIFVIELDNDDVDYLSDTFAIMRAFRSTRVP